LCNELKRIISILSLHRLTVALNIKFFNGFDGS